MIRINCTNCKAQLSIDDAFAGGVCRCQYCGTIQTVPKHLKNADLGGGGGGVSSTGAASTAPKALYRNKSRNGENGASRGSGLDAIADAVATSSGLSGSGLANAHRRLGQAPGGDGPPPVARHRTMQVLVACAVAIVLLLGVIVGVLLRGNGAGATNVPSPASNGGTGPVASNDAHTTVPPVPAAAGGPAFLGVAVPESPVVFVLDHGDAMRDTMEYMKFAVGNSLRTLRKDQKFQVIFWQTGNQKPIVTPKEPSLPTAETLAAVQAAVDNVYSSQSSSPGSALAKAFGAHPGVVVVATSKVVGDDFVKAVMDARKDSTAKVHCLSLDAPASRLAMSEVAKRTGGQYRNVTADELRAVR